MLRGLTQILVCFLFLLCLQSFAYADQPVCVKVKQAKAKLPKPLKPARKTASSVKVPPIIFDQYTPLSWTGKREGRWIEVQSMEGQTYWVRHRDISRSLTCLSVIVQKSQLYTGPGKNFARAEVAEKGAVFLDLGGGEDGWLQVQSSSGVKSWIDLDHTWKPRSRIRMSFKGQ